MCFKGCQYCTVGGILHKSWSVCGKHVYSASSPLGPLRLQMINEWGFGFSFKYARFWAFELFFADQMLGEWSLFSEMNECLQLDTCPHYCTNTKGSFKCTCDRNYKDFNGNCVVKGSCWAPNTVSCFRDNGKKKSDSLCSLTWQDQKTGCFTWLMIQKSRVLCTRSTRARGRRFLLTLRIMLVLSGWTLFSTTKSLSGLPSLTLVEYFTKTSRNEVRQKHRPKTL